MTIPTTWALSLTMSTEAQVVLVAVVEEEETRRMAVC